MTKRIMQGSKSLVLCASGARNRHARTTGMTIIAKVPVAFWYAVNVQ